MRLSEVDSTKNDVSGKIQDYSSRTFRNTLGRFTTGVVLITAKTPSGYVGMAVNSFTSVSLDPPMVLFCPATTSSSWPQIKEAKKFCVTVLGAEHSDICAAFARKGADRFSSFDWTETPSGHPTLPDALAWIDTEITNVQPAGDHEVVLATATAWSAPSEDNPLVFFSGSYRALAA